MNLIINGVPRGLDTQKQRLYARAAHFFVHLFADYDESMPNFTFYGGRKQATTKYYFLFLNLDAVLRNSTSGEFTYIWQSK